MTTDGRDQHMHGAVREVHLEMCRQLARFGEQRHPDTPPDEMFQIRHAVALQDARRDCDRAIDQGKLTWHHILHKEVLEAYEQGARADKDLSALYEELIQVAAVALS